MTWDGGSLGGSSSSSSVGVPSSSESSSSAQSTVTNIQDGCVVLGDTQSGSVPYITRYWINHKKQNRSGDVVRKTCCPFAQTRSSLSCCGATWSVVHSECFLFTCHMIVLGAGALKEIFYMRQWDNQLHLMHSVLENALCALVIFIRVLAVCKQYKDMRKFIVQNEHISSKGNIRGQSIKTAMTCYVCLGMCMLLMLAGCFAVFYLLSHLGWTVLVTNFTLTVMYVAFWLFTAQLNAVVDVIRTDQHKLVLHESVLLLKEGLLGVSAEQRLFHYHRTNHFLTALRNSQFFTLPSYIHVVDGFDHEAITLKELESSV